METIEQDPSLMALPKSSLVTQLVTLHNEKRVLHKEKVALQEEIRHLKEKLSQLLSKQYGKSSERQEQEVSCFDEDEESTEIERTHPKKPRYDNAPPPKKPRLDTSALPREVRYLDLPETKRSCSCGHTLEVFGEEKREELVYEPARLKVVEYIRPKYSCRHCETVKIAPAVELPLPKSKAGSSLLSAIMVSKYQYHLPFYRQSKLFSQKDFDLSSQTLANWVMNAAESLSPLYDAFWREVEGSGFLQVDETPVKILSPEKKGFMWVYHSPHKKFVVFDCHLSRSSAVVNERLKGFKGLLQTDGYSGYNAQRQRTDIISLGCFDHCRRKFVEVMKASSGRGGKAEKVLAKIGKLYALERTFKDLSFAERRSRRQQESVVVLASLRQFLEKIHAPPKSLLGKAVQYALNQWSELSRYVDYGEAFISNCLVENQIRPFALGRRNWLFIGNEASGQKAALIYSLIQSCELNGIEAHDYLSYVLSQVHGLRRGEIAARSLLPHVIDRGVLNI